jgi:uncharacterized protein with PIN domain
MSANPGDEPRAPRFVADRMLGPLTRYLRFMGYDTLSANTFRQGNSREDTQLLGIAGVEDRILLTRDRELARRAGDRAVLILSEHVMAQVEQLVSLGLIDPELVMDRCGLCNRVLRPASREEVDSSGYAPLHRHDLVFFWCEECQKLYWMGSHGRNLKDDLDWYLHHPR